METMARDETLSVSNNEMKTLNKLLGKVKNGKLKGFTNTNITSWMKVTSWPL